MTTNENTNSSSNVTALNALAGLPSLVDSFENAGSLVGSAAAMDTSAIATAMGTSACISATDFPGINALRGVESSTSVANVAVATMGTPSILKSVSSLNDSALTANTALAAMDTPAFHDAVRDIGSVMALNAAADLEQSIGTFGNSSALMGAATMPAFVNALDSFESLTLPFSRALTSNVGGVSSLLLADMAAEMEELTNQTEFAPFFADDWFSELALSATESISEHQDLSGELPSQGKSAESPVDRDFEWLLVKYTYHSLRLCLERLEVTIDNERAKQLLFISYSMVALYLTTSISFDMQNFSLTNVIFQFYLSVDVKINRK